MTGIDTSFLVDLEVIESPRHAGALRYFEDWRRDSSNVFAVYDHVFLEFMHIVTDPRRFNSPLLFPAALARAHFWMRQRRVRIVHQSAESFEQARLWMLAFKLGRKRIIDTHMAAAYRSSGVTAILTANPDDFQIFDAFELPPYR
jgi:predicted nucleic acid-binding protein